MLSDDEDFHFTAPSLSDSDDVSGRKRHPSHFSSDDEIENKNKENNSHHPLMRGWDSDEEKPEFLDSSISQSLDEDDPANKKFALSREDQERRHLFHLFVRTLYDKHYRREEKWHPLELPDYQPYRMAIYQGLQILTEESIKNITTITAIFFAREHAVSIANAIRTLLRNDINFIATSFSSEFCLRLIDAEDDAEKIALTVAACNSSYFQMQHQFIPETLYDYLGLLLQLKKAGIKLTYNICMFIAKSTPSDSPQLIEQMIALHASDSHVDLIKAFLQMKNVSENDAIKIRDAGLMTETVENYIFFTLDLYNQRDNERDVIHLLSVLHNQKIALTEEFISFVVIHASFVGEVNEIIRSLIEKGIQFSCELVSLLLSNPKVSKTIISDFESLMTNHWLPNTFLITPSENKLSPLTENTILQCLQNRNVQSVCKILTDDQRAQIELLDDLMMMCVFSRRPQEIPALLQCYQFLECEGIARENNNEIAFAILSEKESNISDNLLKTHRDKTEAMLNHMKEDALLSQYLPPVLAECVFSFFYSQSAVTQPTCPVNLAQKKETSFSR